MSIILVPPRFLVSKVRLAMGLRWGKFGDMIRQHHKFVYKGVWLQCIEIVEPDGRECPFNEVKADIKRVNENKNLKIKFEVGP